MSLVALFATMIADNAINTILQNNVHFKKINHAPSSPKIHRKTCLQLNG